MTVGGQAANVAAWVSALGGQSRLITALADDPAAGLVASELASRGVDVVGPVISGHTGVIVSLSASGADRSMLTDRGVGPLLTASVIDPGWLDGCSWLHLPAYSLTTSPVQGAALAAAEAARAQIGTAERRPVIDLGDRRLRPLLPSSACCASSSPTWCSATRQRLT